MLLDKQVTTPKNQDSYQDLVDKQKEYFRTGSTLTLDFRVEQLKKMSRLLKENSDALYEALYKDLHRSKDDGFVEIMVVWEEIDYLLKNLEDWMKAEEIDSTIFVPFSKSQVYSEPFGSVLILAPWNYPLQLSLIPLVGALAAGNCVILKPSEMAEHSAKVMEEIINNNFAEEYIKVILGDGQVAQALLEQKVDYIFYTGSTARGKGIMKAAAENLTPLTLELGGKSPCIIDASANLNLAARRIVWGKFFNAGQTCIAPDYLYVHSSVKDELIQKMVKEIHKNYGKKPQKNSEYGRIINAKHFDRLSKLLDPEKIIFGGEQNREDLYISPTLLDNVSSEDPIMQEEIFGPLLPILTFNKIEDLINDLNKKDKPLGLYLFTKDKKSEKNIIERVSFGTGCINDCVIQYCSRLPFGGVGNSGIGKYKGKFSFDTFSNKKAILKRPFPMYDKGFVYPNKGNLIRRFYHWLSGIS